MGIYTRKGDKGETGLISSDKSKKTRVSKSSSIIEAIGSIDEANTSLGLAASFVKNKKIKIKIEKIQKHLFEVGSILAGAKLQIDKNLVVEMEKEIDEMDKIIPKLTHFIIPGGGKGGSLLFMARTFVRRAERRVVSLPKILISNSYILVYLNRLSDYLFTLARWMNFREGVKEKPWIK
jgi:cob(I)alamin adenosyltransferase